MEVKEMTIEDVLKTPLFFENVKRQLTSLWNDREKARKDATRNNTRLRAHVIDRMHNAGQWEPGNFVIIFAKVLDKVGNRVFVERTGVYPCGWNDSV